MDLALWISSIVAFVRAGYPNGMPATGHVPLVALSRRRITDDDIADIASKLIMRGLWKINSADVGVEITRITNEMPSPEDVKRVQRHLDAIGCARG